LVAAALVTEQLADAPGRSLAAVASHSNKAHLRHHDLFSTKDRQVRVFSFALIAALAFGGWAVRAEAQALDNALRNKNLTVSVEIDGSLPGFTSDQLSAYVSQQMAASQITSWHFEPGPTAAATTDQPANRIVWHFKQLPFAGGGVRYIGPAVSKAREVFGVGRAVGIDAKIYLNGQYQATTFDQATVKGGPNDPALAAAIQKVMKSIVANASAEGAADGPKLA
jgi:hypothetical protein